MSVLRRVRSVMLSIVGTVVVLLVLSGVTANGATLEAVPVSAELQGQPLTIPSFADVPSASQFITEITWLAGQGISTGWPEADGSRTYRPLLSVNRDAMAAFLYRLAGNPTFAPPAASPFTDVPVGSQFYKEITWLADRGISAGWTESDGSKTYRPLTPVNRDAMAAFLYRYAGSPGFTPPARSAFTDVATNNPFYKQITWLATTGVSGGWTEADGTKTYRPLLPVNRDAMAAFMYRYKNKLPVTTVPKALTAAPVPTVIGTLVSGQQLTAVSGVWGPAPVTLGYQWKRSGMVVAGATSSLYTLTNSDVGKTMTVTVTGTKTGYVTTSKTSIATGIVAAATIATTATPTISGTAAIGSTLTANTGTWTVGTAFSYQWKADGVAVPGATGTNFTVTSDQVGKSVTVTVTGTKSGFATVSKTSGATSPVPASAIQGTVVARTQRMSDATLHSAQSGWYEAGSKLTLVCYRSGQSVKGYFSPYVGNGGWDSLWYQADDGYFVADIDLETGSLDPVVGVCPGSTTSASTNSTVMATTQRMSDANLNSTQNGTYGAGTRLTLVCYVHGESVRGYFSPYIGNGGYDDLWYKVDDTYFVADVDIETGSDSPVAPACSPPPATDGNDVLSRAQSWIIAGVPYDQSSYYSNQYGRYRQDCSGFVSMALGLSTSYVTGTLPQVVSRINKDDLQPGDIMLNTAAGDSGHTAIFVRWTDSSHSHYVSWEENGAAGRTFEQVVPYPYWSIWAGWTNYFPYRRQ